MPNDAKLGLLTGVIGVIVAAALSLSRPPSGAPPPAQAAGPRELQSATGKPTAAPATAAPSSELAATPVVRTKKDTDATPTSRKPGNDDIDP